MTIWFIPQSKHFWEWKGSQLILNQDTGINQGCPGQTRKYSPSTSESITVATTILTDKETEADIKGRNPLTSKTGSPKTAKELILHLPMTIFS